MFNLDDVTGYVEKVIPAGKYEVEVIKSTLDVWGTGRQVIKLQCKIVDTIPSGQDIDLDEFEDPIGQMVYPNVNIPYGKDEPKYKSSSDGFISKLAKDYINNFSVEIPEDKTDMKEFAENFTDMVGGVIVKYEPSDRNDPESDPRAVADKSCALTN